MTEPLPEKSNGRPRQSIGSIIGFIALGVTALASILAFTLWLGGLDRGVSDNTSRMDRLERDSSDFQKELRTSISTVQQQINLVNVLLAKQLPDKPNAALRRR